MVRTVNRKRNVKFVEATGSASLVERMGVLSCRTVWTLAGLGALVLMAKVLLS